MILKMEKFEVLCSNIAEITINNFPKPVIKLFLALIFILILPGILLNYIFMTLLRTAVLQIKKLLRDDLGDIIEPLSSALAVDLMSKKPPNAPILITVYLKGKLEVKELQNSMMKIVNLKNSNGEFQHPELRSYPYPYFGFLFWKKDANFAIQTHVKEWMELSRLPKILNEDDIVGLGKILYQKHFESKKSPWEFLILYNTREKNDVGEGERTTLVLRIHHSLGDGYSLLHLLMQNISKTQVKLPKLSPISPLNSTYFENDKFYGISRFCFLLMSPFIFIFDLSSALVEHYDINHYHIYEKNGAKVLNAGLMERLPLSDLKKIKNKHGLSFTGTILGIFAIGLREFLIENELEVPHEISCLTPEPHLKHTVDKLRNQFSLGFIKLPLSKMPASKTLQLVDESFKNLRSSTVSSSMQFLTNLCGSQFYFVSKYFFRNFLTTGVVSNFPGPDSEAYFDGLPILDIGFAAGFGPGSSTIGFSALSYNGNIRIAVGIDEAILPSTISCSLLITKIKEVIDSLNKNS